jgi:6-pyruvoyltetrahydropterin/6-carboxytetrahydropterin synthase
MYYIEKKLEIAGAHRLDLNYESKCKNFHGHNWMITIYCKSENLNQNGMVIDFTQIKKVITDKLDHQNLNEIFNFNPTAENIAFWIVSNTPHCYKADVIESENNKATYEIQD